MSFYEDIIRDDKYGNIFNLTVQDVVAMNEHSDKRKAKREGKYMGAIYSIACKTCKITRDLDKFYTANLHEAESRAQALKFKDNLYKDDWFRAGLLISFMGKHMGHECVFFDEHTDNCEEELGPFENKHGYVEDVDFWQTTTEVEPIQPE